MIPYDALVNADAIATNDGYGRNFHLTDFNKNGKNHVRESIFRRKKKYIRFAGYKRKWDLLITGIGRR
jgi:hypothetical protein